MATTDNENNTRSGTSMVDHPFHYNRSGAIECIDEMELVFGLEATANFCLLNCWKYRYRAGLKNNGYEDLEKSDWYMNRYKELREKISAKNANPFISLNKNQFEVVPLGTTLTSCSNI